MFYNVSFYYVAKWISSTWIPSFLDFFSPPFRSPESTEFPVLYSRFSLVIYFIHSSVFTAVQISQFISTLTSPPPLVTINLFSTSVSLFLLCRYFHLYHFSKFTCKWYYIIFVFLSYLLHSVWQSLGLSMSLQMTQFHSFIWLSDIPLYICSTLSLSTSLLMNI